LENENHPAEFRQSLYRAHGGRLEFGQKDLFGHLQLHFRALEQNITVTF
jgi:hypothetical protein